jgi:hypothetical protein
MNSSRLGILWLTWLCFAACATAQDSLPSGSDDTASGATAGAFDASGATSFGAAGAFSGAGATNQAGAIGFGAGAGGGAGLFGSGGASGNAASAGSGGATFESGACAANPTMSLQYMQGSTNPKQITAEYTFINTSDTPIPLAQLKIRYFFSNEETSGWTTAIYAAQLDGGTGGYRPISGTTLTVVPLGQTLPGADTYAELAFTSPLTIEQGATGTISWDMQPNDYNPPDQVQANDYSYNAADTTLTPWDHVVIYQGDTVVWGCAPAAAGGTGGAGGAGSNNGGASGATAGGASAGSAGSSAGGSAGAAATAGGGASAGSGGASAGSGGASAGSGGASAGSGG